MSKIQCLLIGAGLGMIRGLTAADHWRHLAATVSAAGAISMIVLLAAGLWLARPRGRRHNRRSAIPAGRRLVTIATEREIGDDPLRVTTWAGLDKAIRAGRRVIVAASPLVGPRPDVLHWPSDLVLVWEGVFGSRRERGDGDGSGRERHAAPGRVPDSIERGLDTNGQDTPYR